MRNRIAVLTIMLLLGTCCTLAQKRIKSIDITVELPKADEATYNDHKVTAVTTDLFGEEKELIEGKTFECATRLLEFNDYGEIQEIHEEEIEAGRDYIIQIGITSYHVNNPFNYKNDKNYTVDNTTLNVTVNGKPAKIFLGNSHSITCEIVYTVPGTRNPWYASTTPSPADGDMNGCGYVDLGLPSGNLWATCNVGASKPEEYGDFFGYGETKTKKTFTSDNFVGYGAYTGANPYNLKSFKQEDMKYSVEGGPIAGRRLKFEHDAANKNMGGEWRMPTKKMATELTEYCNAKYVKINGIPGTLWISRINGKSIFTPYCGEIVGDAKQYLHEQGFYWTSNARRVTSIQANWWGSQYNTSKMYSRTEGLLSVEGGGGIEAPEEGMPVRGVWANGSKASKSERTKKAKDVNKTRKANREAEYERVYGDGGDENESNTASSSENVTEKKKSKGSLKNLLNRGKTILNILR